MRINLLLTAAIAASVVVSEARAETYAEARTNFFSNNADRMRAQYEYTNPPVYGKGDDPTKVPPGFWGAMNYGIAATFLAKKGQSASLDSNLIARAVQEQARTCLPHPAHLPNDKMCAILQWPALVRLFYFSESLPATSSAKLLPDDRKVVLQFFLDILKRETEVIPPGAAGAWDHLNDDSENHLFAARSSYLLAAQALALDPEWKDKKIEITHPDTKVTIVKTPTQLYTELRDHWLAVFAERIRRGLFVEVASAAYHDFTLTAVLNIHDFSANEELSKKARDFLDITFAMTAMETLPNGARAGSQSRKRPPISSAKSVSTPIYQFYFLTTKEKFEGESFRTYKASPHFLGSSYFPSSVVWALWGNASKSRSYEVSARQPGGVDLDPNGVVGKHINPDIVAYRTTYVTPSYALGSNLLDLNQHHFSRNASEARSISLFVNEGNADREFKDIPQILFSPGANACFDKGVAVQSRNAMVYQNNIDFFLHGGRLEAGNDGRAEGCYGLLNMPLGTQSLLRSKRTFLGAGGKEETAELIFPEGPQYITSYVDQTRSSNDLSFTGGWKGHEGLKDYDELFLESQGGSTYVWVKPVAKETTLNLKGFYLDGYDKHADNKWTATPADVRLNGDKFSPIAVVVSAASNYPNFEAFKRDMKRSKLHYESNKVTLQPSLRSSMEYGDIFQDTTQANTEGTSWREYEDPSYFGDVALRASGANAKMVFTFTPKETDYYYLKALVLGENANSDSFKVQLDDGEVKTWTFPFRSSKYVWHDLPALRSDGDRYLLEKGKPYKLTFTKGEAWAGINAIMVLRDRKVVEAPLIEFSENINRTQPMSKIDGVEIQMSAVHQSHVFKSPYVNSLKSSNGVWDIRFGNEYLIIDQSGTKGVRKTGTTN